MARPTTIPLDVIQIKAPCSASWDAMAGDDARRFCDDCQLHVHNLASMRRRDAEALIQGIGQQRVCVQLQRTADGRILTKDDRMLHVRLRRRAAYVSAKLLVGLTTAALVMAGATTVLASRGPQWSLKLRDLRVRCAPPAHATPVPGEALVEPMIMGDIAVEMPPPPVMVGKPAPAVRGQLAVPVEKGEPIAVPPAGVEQMD